MSNRLVQTLVGVYGFYDRELTEFAIRIWTDSCAEFDVADLERAFSMHLKDPDAGRFLPKPADIIRQIRGDDADNALIAWGQVLSAVRGGYDLSVDDATRDAVRSLGGFSVIARADESQNGYLQRRFVDAFKAYKRRADSQPLLHGPRALSIVGEK